MKFKEFQSKTPCKIDFVCGVASFFMGYMDWANCAKPYSANRSIERRIAKPYLNEELREVDLRSRVTGVLFNGEVINIDSHARVENWKNGKLGAPKNGLVYVTLFAVNSQEEVDFLYDQENSLDSRATNGDQVTTAILRSGYKPQTAFTKKFTGAGVWALLGLRGCLDEAFVLYQEELKFIDALGIDKDEMDKYKEKTVNGVKQKCELRKKYSAPIMAAMLKSFKENPEKATKFWLDYRDDDESVSSFLDAMKTQYDQNGGVFQGYVMSQADVAFRAYKD